MPITRNKLHILQQVHRVAPVHVLEQLYRILEQKYSDLTLWGGIGIDDALHLYLYYLSTGESYIKLQAHFGHPKSNMRSLFGSLRRALNDWTEDMLQDKRSFDERQIILSVEHPEYFQEYPEHTLIIDGTHIPICRSGLSPDFDQKHFSYKIRRPAMNYQVIISHDTRVVWVSAGKPGTVNDISSMRFFSQSILANAIKDEREVVLADAGYQGSSRYGLNFHTPHKRRPKRQLPVHKDVENRVHSLIRRKIENFFGAIKNKFRILARPVRHRGRLERLDDWLRFIFALHNASLDILSNPVEQDQVSSLVYFV